MKAIHGLFWSVFLLIGSTSAFSEEFQSSRTLSLGRTGRGGAILNDTIHLNPALLGFQAGQAASGTYNWVSTPSIAPGSDRNFNVSVVDGKNQYLAAGISFTRQPTLDLIHVATARKVFDDLAFGVSVKRFSTRNSNAEAAKGKQTVSGFEGSTSLAYNFSQTFIGPIQLGLMADNLRHKKEDEAYVGPRQIGFGTKLTVSSLLMIYGDVVENFSHEKGTFPTYAAGTEVSLGSDLYARGGLYGFRETGWSGGLGWIGPKIGFSYGYQTRKQEAERGYQHSVTMDIYM